jgi:magnesium-dependent phosphatase 1
VAYHEILFFDNESGNVREVGQLGVTSVFCPGGMSQGAWEEGLQTYAKNAKMRSSKSRA